MRRKDRRQPRASQERIRDLWNILFPAFQQPTMGLARHQAIIELLHYILHEAAQEHHYHPPPITIGTTDSEHESVQLEAARTAIELLQVLQTEIGELIHKLDPSLASDHAEPPVRRRMLRRLLDQGLAGSSIPGLRLQSVLDPVPVLISRPWALELRDALEAIDAGETLPLLKAEGRRRQEPWSRDQARMRALEHVHFIVGQGHRKKTAVWRVSAAMCVPEKTLRDWEGSVSKDEQHRLETARFAGKLAEGFADDVARIGWTSEYDNPAERALWVTLSTEEPLAKFGARYQQKFGRHHFKA